MTLDYASPPPRKITLDSLPAAAILVAWWFVYAAACNPAMGQRGYPPLEAHLQGLTILWIAAIPLSALVQRFSWWRVLALALYAYATAFIDAASWPMMVPNHFDLLYNVFVTMIFFGPIHVGVAAVLEGLSRLTAHCVTAVRQERPAPLAVRIIVALVLLTGAGFLPSAYAAYDAFSLSRKGASLAEADWNAHRARVIETEDRFFEPIAGVRVEVHVDEATGLMLYTHSCHGWETAYNQRIAALIRQRGKPSWAAPALPSPADLANLLDANGFTEISKFPFEVTPNITVFHGGSIAKWSKVSSAPGPGLSIATKEGLIGVGDSAKPTFVLRDPSCPSLVFIRDGHDWLGVFDDDGKFLADVSRE